jgi:hypothetical protein
MLDFQKEGIFRIPGSAEAIKKLRVQIDNGMTFSELKELEIKDRQYSVRKMKKFTYTVMWTCKIVCQRITRAFAHLFTLR